MWIIEFGTVGDGGDRLGQHDAGGDESLVYLAHAANYRAAAKRKRAPDQSRSGALTHS